MQQSAVPELAHAHPRPIHWLATATALAGVMALSSALQPDAARAAQSGPEAKPAPAVVGGPDPAHAGLPLGCGPVDLSCQPKASGEPASTGRPETVAV
ncbi:hypothetical protein PV398_36200, partial [Streptomyces ipomoeae]|nr:hypothetical protein [Streptomyces ipomoeae]